MADFETVENEVMDQAVETTSDISEQSSGSGIGDLIWKGVKFVGKVGAAAAIGTAVGHYVNKACNSADEKARIRKAGKEAEAAEKAKIKAEKEAAEKAATVETSDEGQKVLAETAE